VPVVQQRAFLDQLRAEWGALSNTAADVAVAAQRVWTSAQTGGGTQFCTMLCAAMRADPATLAEACAMVARALNANNLGRVAPERVVFPQGPHAADAQSRSTHAATCWRGGGFRDTPENRAFFHSRAGMAEGDPAKKYRVAQYLATSFSNEVARSFILRAATGAAAPGAFVNALVRWRVRLDPDPQRRCRHVNFVMEGPPGEHEYLFAAFSVFSVVAVHWSPTPQDAATPHEITILAAYDNSQEDEGLPLAPWC
jgi:hypothetical protein